jgi:hypothetical protein
MGTAAAQGKDFGILALCAKGSERRYAAPYQRLPAQYPGRHRGWYRRRGWISTAYPVAEIVVIPLTEFLTPVFSLRRDLLGSSLSNAA